MSGPKYVKTFRESTTQLNTIAIGAQWFRMGIDLDTAVKAANNGYLPDEFLILVKKAAAAMDDTDDCVIEFGQVMGY